MTPGGPRRWLHARSCAPAAVLVLAATGAALAARSLLLAPPDLAAYRLPSTLLLTDRGGATVRFLTDERWRRHLWIEADRIPPVARAAFLAAEDKRFASHPGFDILAIARAAAVNLRAGHVVSGASTITQQLAKSAHPGPRSLRRKIAEVLEAVRLERALTKEEILTLYLNRVDLGNNLLGIEAAARAYFGKRAADLDAVEAATLAALPKSPTLLDPWGGRTARLLQRRNWVLGRMAALGSLDPAEAAAAPLRPLGVLAPALAMEAPHLVDSLLESGTLGGREGVVPLTIELGLQRELEALLLSHRGRLAASGASQAAAVIVDNRTLGVLALAGALEYGPAAQGFVNGAAARRSAGSILKPFLYGLAMDRGYAPASVLDDFEQAFRSDEGEYLPLNADRQSEGPVNLRLALGRSLNLPAVHLLRHLGTEGFYGLLTRLELLPPNAPPPEAYGLGLGVGNPEVRLVDLAAAYAALANGGVYRPLRVLRDEPPPAARSVLSPEAAFLVTDILSDPLPRPAAFAARGLPAPLALKTGTSTRFRDAWTVGYTDLYTVAVWVGNFDGRETARLFGGEGAGPILCDVMRRLYGDAAPRALPVPDTVTRVEVCAQSGVRPGPGCRERVREYFVLGAEPRESCAFHEAPGRHDLPARYARWLGRRHAEGRAGRYRLAGLTPDLDQLFQPDSGGGTGAPGQPARAAAGEIGAPSRDSGVRILYPLADDRYLLPRGEETLELRLEAATEIPLERVVWFVDGEEFGSSGPPYSLPWRAGRGRHRVMAADPAGYGETIEVRVE